VAWGRGYSRLRPSSCLRTFHRPADPGGVADGLAEVLHQQEQMQRVRWRWLEPHTEPSIEARSLLGLRVNEQRSHAGSICDRGTLQKGVPHEGRAESVALLGEVDAKPREDDDRHRVATNALRDSWRHLRVSNGAGRQRVVPGHKALVPRADHIHLRRIRLVSLARMAPEPGCLLLGSAVKGLEFMILCQQFNGSVCGHASSSTLGLARNAASAGSERGSRSSRAVNASQRSSGRTKETRSAKTSWAAVVA